MNKREARKQAALAAHNILEAGNNEFLATDENGELLNEKDAERLRQAWDALLDELWRRGR